MRGSCDPSRQRRLRRRSAALFFGVVAALAALPSVAAAQDEGDAPSEEIPAQEAPDTAVRGTLREQGEPVAGVEIVVTTLAGDEIGRTESDSEGEWRIPVPGPGRYQVQLIQDSLPDGVSLRDADNDTRVVSVLPRQDRVAVFALGERVGGSGRALSDRLARSLTNGVKFGLIIAMTAVGLSLIFGTTGLINFAHSELVTFGAIVAWYFNATGPEFQLIGAALIAIAIAGLLGAGLERGLWRPLRERQLGNFQLLVISIGLSLFGRHALLIWFGGRSKPYSDYTIQQELDFGPLSITPRDLVVMGLSVAILVAVAVILQRTRMGKAMRAVSDSPDLAESSGIDVRRVVMAVWIAGSALAATGGIFLGAIETVNWLMGFRLLLLMFAGVILGGLGTAYGALVGSLVVGIATEMSTIWFSAELKLLWALLVLIGVLLVRPQGILGVKERVG